MLEALKKSIQENNEESFHQHLAELERLLQNNGTVREWLATSGALNYAAEVGSIPMISTLVQKGLGKVATVTRRIALACVHATYLSIMKGQLPDYPQDQGISNKLRLCVWFLFGGCLYYVTRLINTGAH